MNSRPVIKVTDHALHRYRERIDPLASDAVAMAVLAGRVVLIAVEFGCRVVRIPRGRIILEFTPVGATVITVFGLGRNFDFPTQLRPADRGGPMPTAHERALFQLAGDRP